MGWRGVLRQQNVCLNVLFNLQNKLTCEMWISAGPMLCIYGSWSAKLKNQDAAHGENRSFYCTWGAPGWQPLPTNNLQDDKNNPANTPELEKKAVIVWIQWKQLRHRFICWSRKHQHKTKKCWYKRRCIIRKRAGSILFPNVHVLTTSVYGNNGMVKVW